MSYQFDSRLGERLFQLLPEVYRTRDRNLGKSDGVEVADHLARYLDVHGEVLDLLHATLQQQLRDALPGTSQDWLIPYFARLVAANIVSPDTAGKHQEVMNAVAWRQRKGTLACAEQIAEAVAQTEVELQEGWQRVVVTPRVDLPLRPVESWDSSLSIDAELPASAIRHPSLPAATVDTRRASRAVGAEAGNPAARESKFNGLVQTWRHANRHGAPCFPGSFDDLSRRTVDMRSATSSQGHYHPKRLLAFAPPEPGLMPPAPIRIEWEQRTLPRYAHLFDVYRQRGIWTIANRSDRVVQIEDAVSLTQASVGAAVKPALYRVEGIDFLDRLEVEAGSKLELRRVEADRVDVDTPGLEEPVVTLEDCLLRVLSARGLVRAEASTVLEEAYVRAIEARDCLLMNLVGSDISGVLEYSRYPPGASLSADRMTIEDCTTDEPAFFALQQRLAARAALAPGTPATIHGGASDGGEMGYFHAGRAQRPVLIDKNFSGTRALTIPTGNRYPLRDLIFTGRVVISSGKLELVRSAVRSLEVETAVPAPADALEDPVLDARDCLFDEVRVADALARFEYCTIMRAAHCLRLQASDCIFAGAISNAAGGEPAAGCLRYSRLPRKLIGAGLNIHAGPTDTNTRELPVFVKLERCDDGAYALLAAEFGEPGYGVLDAATVAAIRFGAEDGGEMGAGHHRYYSLKTEAMLDKLREFLPIGIEAVLIRDARLLQPPPQIKNSTSGET